MRLLKLHPILLLIAAPALVAATIPGRYIVELSSEPVLDHFAPLRATGRLHTSAAVSYRATVLAEQQRVRSQVALQSGTVLDSVNNVANALFVEVPDAAAANLASLPGVKRVYPMRTFHMVLDRAIALHKVIDAWNQIGADRAGAGMKIAIIDSGIDSSHPGFQDSSLSVPDSFPRVNNSTDTAYTNNKVIVARSYVNLLPSRDPDTSARDRVGHGTALAMVAAGVRNSGPLATITGVAPKAQLGNYKVFGTPGYNDGASDAAILKAIDDAVSDGMDVINLSLGDDLAPRLSDDIDAQAVERVTKAGVIVVVAAGNNGPDPNTMSSPADAPSAIAVGASTNDRTFSESVEIAGLSTFAGIGSDGPTPVTPVSGAIADVAAIDGNGMACSQLPDRSLNGRIALVLRGTCTFEYKLNNAQQAGAVGALVYAAKDSPDAIPMAVGTAVLPAEMISYDDGIAIQQALASQSSLVATLRFTPAAVSVTPNLLAEFSAAGPTADINIKPDLLGVGQNIYVATQSLDPNGDMYDASGYILVDGTSFSAPLVAGAAALVKSARPGLTVDQYRSLLINSAAAVQARSGQMLSVQQTGGGLLDANAALQLPVTAYPTAVNFGTGSGSDRSDRVLTITNVSSAPDTFTIAALSRNGTPLPVIATTALQLAPGASASLPVSWTAAGIAPGTYEGTFTVMAASSGTQAVIPYWYAVQSSTPARITLLDSTSSARRGSVQRDAVLFRITDASGLISAAEPQATVVSGGGAVRGIVSHDADVPGVYGLDVQLGILPGTNVFRVQAGDVTMEFAITGR